MNNINSLPIYVVEAFTTGKNEQFTGNTAAVCFLEYDDQISDALKLKIALEMNLSETVFVTKGWTKETDLNSLETNRWTIRWFTPTLETRICGHATLASARTIFEIIFKKQLHHISKNIIFESKYRGPLGAAISNENQNILITLDFPSSPTIPIPSNGGTWVQQLVSAVLGNSAHEILEQVHYSILTDYMVLCLRNTGNGAGANEALLRAVRPNFQAMLAIEDTWKTPLTGKSVQGLAITIRGEPSCPEGPHFLSRFLGGWSGVDEDPVCGSAHTVLTPFWKQRFADEGIELERFVAKQVSERGGQLVCTVDGDRVTITGTTRMVLQGSFLI